MKTVLCVIGLAFASVALATPPPAPTLSVGTTDIKQLTFEIQSVPRVNWYELWFKANDAAQWVKFTQVPAQQQNWIRINLAVHLLDWQQARYHVKACNPGGCSASNEVGVNDEKLAAIGYFKPNAPTGVDHYGGHVAVSADGKTIAVVSGETFGTATTSAAVHVYRKTTSTSGWRREARVVPSAVRTGTAQYYLGDQLAISADGNLIALGAWTERTPSAESAGAVYLFRRSGTTWREAQKITSSSTRYGDYFGYIVKLDDAGRTLAIHHNNTGPEYIPSSGTLEIYLDAANDGNDQFVHSTTLAVPLNSEGAGVCGALTFSGDGQTLFRGCYDPANYTDSWYSVLKAPDWTESARLPGWDVSGIDSTYDGTRVIIQFDNYGEVYALGAGGWVNEAHLTDFFGEPDGSLRRQVAISRDGKIAAIGHQWDAIAGLGPLFPPYQGSDRQVGSVVIHERRASGWVTRRVIKPGSTNQQDFGHVVALGDNGKILVVGAPTDMSNATGIDGNRDDSSVLFRGAVWVY